MLQLKFGCSNKINKQMFIRIQYISIRVNLNLLIFRIFLVTVDEDEDDDDDSMTDSSYDIYNDSEDDFLVVPMPACFNLEKPISFQQPESQSEDERGDDLDDNHNRIHVAGMDLYNLEKMSIWNVQVTLFIIKCLLQKKIILRD